MRYGQRASSMAPAAPQVDLVEDVVLQLALDRVVAGQEAAADAQGPLPQAQVEAGRLDVGLGDVEPPGVDVAGPDGALEQVAREDALGLGCRLSTMRARRSGGGMHGHDTSKARRMGTGKSQLRKQGRRGLWMTWGRLR